MANGYNPAKAVEFNKLILQGIPYDEAVIMADISLNEIGNYSFDPETSVLSQQEGPPDNQTPVDAATDPNTNVGADAPRAERIGTVDAASDPNTNVGADTPREIPITESVFDPRQDVGENVFDPRAATPNPAVTVAAQLNDPYAGLTPAQLQDLGGADPTDPYIRARLGIPQLPGSVLASTPGFGTIKTGIPLVDNALSSLGSLFSFSGKTTKPSVTKTGTTTGTTTPVDTSATAQDAAKLLVQTPALTDDEDQNLQNIVGAQGEIVRAEENIQSNNRQILANEEAQAAAQEQQRQAQAIIDENNAELADDNLPDSRRAELEANNAAQRASIAENAAVIDEAQTNIDSATANNEQQTDSIITNQGVVGENSEAFTANSSELGAPVVADNDPETAVDQNFLDANAEVQAETTLTILSEEETNALFDGAEPGLVDSFVEVDETVTELTEEETAALFDGTEAAVEPEESVFDPENVDPNSDPFEQARFEAELAAEVPANEIVLTADEQAAADDPFEARRLELEQEANRQELAEQATDVEPTDDPFEQRRLELEQEADEERAVELTPEELAAADDPFEQRRLELEQEANRQELAEQATEVEPTDDPFEARRLELEREADEQEANRAAGDNVDSKNDQGLPQSDGTTQGIQDQINEQNAAAEAAARDNAKNQATLQARYKQPASSDWRVRLQLAPGANYLYKAGKDGIDAGILKPLYDTDGVIFPYTPSIETSYNANYEMYDLTHSNFRGYFYKNSRVNDINIRATFTAQDTQEAAYLLAVIHFFRSVTKMFYGAKDAYRGAPPPLTYLSGLGEYQFNQHPCVVSQFNYSLPPDVDYIRANAPNNYGTNLLTQRARTGAIAPTLGSASLTRLLGTLTKPPVGATATPPTPGMINQNVNNTSQATYVPTKIELSITLLPINTRSQVSTQFNMKEFASGALISKGFW